MAVIPITLSETTLGNKSKGDTVNIEVDIIARYIKRFLDRDESSDGLSLGKLIEGGFA